MSNDATLTQLLRKGLRSTNPHAVNTALHAIERQRDQARFIGWPELEASFQRDALALRAHMEAHGIEVAAFPRDRNQQPTVGIYPRKKRAPLRMRCYGTNCGVVGEIKGWRRHSVNGHLHWFCTNCSNERLTFTQSTGGIPPCARTTSTSPAFA